LEYNVVEVVKLNPFVSRTAQLLAFCLERVPQEAHRRLQFWSDASSRSADGSATNAVAKTISFFMIASLSFGEPMIGTAERNPRRTWLRRA
jgi:hypothetical protein